MLKTRVVFVLAITCALLCMTVATHAATLCAQAQCSISIEFLNGGTISTATQATLIFGEDAGISLGDSGEIFLGDGGTFDNLTLDTLPGGDIPAAGSAITLGNGANINFGPNGWINLGTGGNIQYLENNTLTISNPSAIVIV
ncbi:MAG: hypothetical protein PVJ72_17570, partial [Gammaproteobacteria bacterium]